MTREAIDRYKKRSSDLECERSSWISQYQEISRYLLPRNGRFLISDVNKGYKRHNDIYDNTGTRALRVLSAGLMGSATSPARPWFRLATTDPSLMGYAPVKSWLSHVSDTMRIVFNKSNTYSALHNLYEELGAFGTGCNILLPDYDTVIYQYPQTAGQYCISTDDRDAVDTVYRTFQMTLGQMVQQFGKENLSTSLQMQLTDRKGIDKWYSVTHLVQPRKYERREAGKRDNKNMRFESVYFETDSNEDKLLSESGFRRFPALCPRWHVMGGDIYGNSPGQEALGDIKELRHAQLRKSQGLDYIVKPPLQIPADMKESDVDLLPGGINYVAAVGNGVRPLFEVRPDINAQVADIQDIRMRIEETFYKPLFMMLDNFDAGKMTATEVAERHQEKLQMVGPVVERLHNELLSPLIDITFDRMLQAGILPPAPAELHGQDLNVEFVSVLAQAQRAIGTTGIDRLLGTVGAMAQFDPKYLDKLKGDDIIDAYSDYLGVDPDLIEANDNVAIIRDQRAKQQAQMQQLAAMQQMAATAKDAASAVSTAQPAGASTDQFMGY